MLYLKSVKRESYDTASNRSDRKQGQVIKKIMNLQERNQEELVYIKHRDTKFCNYLSEKMPGVHRVRGFAAYERRKINSVSYGQENKNSVSPCLCV